ncbi:AraC family transcriptional regulator [Roseiarcus fermentans]|uniref:AraC family transcriptional regulator n=1 Tax=Roseiarcus fermentans TaxID=1473586 RepID=A0A366FS71_9HYPH|nr:AraC family transcriptional regulator [Roseiarcus fermentans]RBP16900.1 AraC family transcriptional regulator [Roseiarcus fermentans]
MERRLIAVSFVEEALDSVRRRGLPTAPLLAAAGLPEAVVEPVSPQSYGAMWLAIAKALDDEYFGLGGRPLRPGSFTLLCHCVLNARTLGQALRRALRFLRVALDDPYGELTVADGIASVTLVDAGGPRSAFAYRTFWIILVGVLCWLVGRRIPLRLVDFRGREPDHCADYRKLFGAPVRFGRKASRLSFDARYLALPTKRDEASLRQFLRGAPANILVRYAYDEGLAAAVRRRLRALPASDWPDLPDLARALAMPASTLRHRLSQEGQSWRAIRETLRQERALQRLAEGRLGVADIAAELGFAEPSAFHRAFRKWTGATPGTFRRKDARADLLR